MKQPGREVDHSHPPSADVKNSWSHISNLALFLHGVHADILTRNYYLQAEAILSYNTFPICPETIRTLNFFKFFYIV